MNNRINFDVLGRQLGITNPLTLEFTNSLTGGEFLHELLSYVKNIVENSQEVEDKIYLDFEKKFKELTEKLQNDTTYYDRLMPQIKEYCVALIGEMIGDSIKYITFGLSEDGYFIAYIPENLNNIYFDTSVDVNSSDYGKLQVIF